MELARFLFLWRRGSRVATPTTSARLSSPVALLLAGLTALSSLVAPISAKVAEAQPWVVYYSDTAPTSAFDPYRLVVLDSHKYPTLRPLSDRGKLLLGYLSLGEVNNGRDYFAEVKAQGFLLQANENWPGSFFVDLLDKRWTKRVVEELVPDILHRGFDGLFLDTLDNAGHLERQDGVAYRGMTEAGAALVRTIRRNFPSIPIMLNRAYDLLPGVEDHVDMVLGESLFADYDFATKTYGRVEPSLYRQQVEILHAAKARRPALRLFSLDYADPADIEGIAAIYREERANGFEPYVATIELDRIVPEPRR